MDTQKVVCPICKRDDRVQKVTSIITAQTREVSGGSYHTRKYVDKKGKLHSEDYYVPYESESSSLLAKSLNHPPPKPGKGCNDTLGLTLGGGILLFGVLCFLCAFIGEVSLLISIPQAFLYSKDADLLLANTSSLLVNGVISAIQGLVAVGLIILGIVVYRKLNKTHQERVARYNDVDLPQWEKATARWEKLYYCYRNDCVFLAGEHEAVPIVEMNQLLYAE